MLGRLCVDEYFRSEMWNTFLESCIVSSDLGLLYIHVFNFLIIFHHVIYICVVVVSYCICLHVYPSMGLHLLTVLPTLHSTDIHTLFDYVPLELLHHVTVRRTYGQWLALISLTSLGFISSGPLIYEF